MTRPLLLLPALLLLLAARLTAAPPDLTRVHDLPGVVATLAPDTKITRDALIAEMTLGGTTDLPHDRAEFLAAAGLALDALLNRLLLVELAAAAGVAPDPASAKSLFQTWRASLGEDPRVPAFTVAQERRMLRQFTDKDMIDRYVRDHVLKAHPVTDEQVQAMAQEQGWPPNQPLDERLRERIRAFLEERTAADHLTARLKEARQRRQLAVFLPRE